MIESPAVLRKLGEIRLTWELENVARRWGCELFGVTSAKPFEEVSLRIKELEKIPGYKEHMASSDFGRPSKVDPRLALPTAESIVVCGIPTLVEYTADNSENYKGPHVKMGNYWRVCRPIVAGVADCVADYLRNKGFETVIAPYGGPISLKPAAVRAGLGNRGKSSLVYTKELGSWLFFIGIITNAKLDLTEKKEEEQDICGDCCKCLEACPTGSLLSTDPYHQNPMLCRLVQYHPLMMEVPEIPDWLKEKMENYLVPSCDICTEVCPHNIKVKPRKINASFPLTFYDVPLPNRKRIPLSDILKILEDDVHPYFQRAAAICLGNVGEEDALPALKRMRDMEDSLVRKYAEWAINKIKQNKAAKAPSNKSE